MEEADAPEDRQDRGDVAEGGHLAGVEPAEREVLQGQVEGGDQEGQDRQADPGPASRPRPSIGSQPGRVTRAIGTSSRKPTRNVPARTGNGAVPGDQRLAQSQVGAPRERRRRPGGNRRA